MSRFGIFTRTFSSSVVLQNSRLSIPKRTTEVPNVLAFLTKIGRDSLEHSEIFSTWKKLFTITSVQMKDQGIETALRRYILNWRYKFSQDNTIKLKAINTGKKRNGGERNRREFLAKERIAKRNELREFNAKLNSGSE